VTDRPDDAPRRRAQTLRDLRTQIESLLTVPFTVRVESPYGVATYRVEPLPYSDPDSGSSPWPDPPRLTPMDRCLLEAAGGSPRPLTGEELAKLAGYYPVNGSVRDALVSLRNRGLLGGSRGSTGYPLTDAGRRALSP